MNQHRNAQQNIKRNYTISTLKSLFRDSDIWHTSNPYIVKCKKIIQRHTEQFNRTLIHNLSGSNLTENQNEVLCKGLGFVFTPTNQNKNPQNSIPDFKRRIDNRLFFKDRTQRKHHPFKKPNTNWEPPSSQNKTLKNIIQELIEIDNKNINSIHDPNFSSYNNFTNLEREALHSLKTNNNIIIKSCDKGGGICILNKHDYINKINDHLNDTNTYEQLNFNPTSHISYDANTFIDFLNTRHHIDYDTKCFLQPKNPTRTPIFYGLPKIHKPNTPLRPIVSGFDSPTDNLARYITHFLQLLAQLLPSHIKD